MRMYLRSLLPVLLAVLLLSEPSQAQHQAQSSDCEGAWALGSTRIRRGTWATYWAQPATPGAVTKRLMAGQHTDVGTVVASIAGETLSVRYAIDAGQPWELTKADLYVASGAPTQAAPGQFPHHSGAITTRSYQFSIPLSTFGTAPTLYLAAYAEVCPHPAADPNDLGTGTLTATGGTLTFPGLTIEVEEGELLDAVTFQVALVPMPAALPAGVTANGPTFDISLPTGARALDAPVTLRFTGLSDDGDPDTMLTVLHFNEALGKYEPLTLWDTASTSVVVESRAFSSFTPIDLALSSAPQEYFLDGFTADTKGWSIENDGSALSPEGHCGGMAAYAAWMYIAHPDESLFSKYDGYLAQVLALRAQATQDNAFFEQEDQLIDDLSGLTEVQMGQYARAALSMFDEPLFLLLTNSAGGSSHAATVYGYDEFVFYLYDPNFVGDENELFWTETNGFGDYLNGNVYNKFYFIALPSLGSHGDFQMLYDEAERGYASPEITISEPVDGANLCDVFTVEGTVGDLTWTHASLYAPDSRLDTRLSFLEFDFGIDSPLSSGEHLLVVVAGENLENHSSFGPNAAARAFRVSVGPPVVDSVTHPAEEPAGEVGDFVVFSATTEGTPTSYLWDFGIGAAPVGSPGDAEQVVELLAAGIHTGTLSVANECGAGPSFEFTYQVDDCQLEISGVTPSSGVPGQVVTFRAAVVGSPQTYQWFFDGGAVPNTPTVPEPTVTLGGIGSYDGWVEMTDPCGISSTLPFTFEIGSAVLSGHLTGHLELDDGEGGVLVDDWEADVIVENDAVVFASGTLLWGYDGEFSQSIVGGTFWRFDEDLVHLRLVLETTPNRAGSIGMGGELVLEGERVIAIDFNRIWHGAQQTGVLD